MSTNNNSESVIKIIIDANDNSNNSSAIKIITAGSEKSEKIKNNCNIKKEREEYYDTCKQCSSRSVASSVNEDSNNSSIIEMWTKTEINKNKTAIKYLVQLQITLVVTLIRLIHY